MFERFTDRARRVVVLAQEEARLLNHNYIGTEHLLLGLVHEAGGVAGRALGSLDVSLAAVRQQVEEIIGRGQISPRGHVPFTPRAKKVLEIALREALQLQHNYIGTEHILLGILRESEGVACQILTKMDRDLGDVRARVIEHFETRARIVDQLESEGASGRPEGPFGEEAAVEEQLAVEMGSSLEAPTEPLCPVCRARMLDTASYRILEVAEHGGEGHRRVLFLFCTACGTTIDDEILPEDS